MLLFNLSSWIYECRVVSSIFLVTCYDIVFLCVWWARYTSLFYFLLFLIGEKLLYNFVLVSALQQCESVIIVDTYTYPSPPSPALIPPL